MTTPGSFESTRIEGLPRDLQFRLDRIIARLADQTHAELVFLADQSGRLVAVEGGIGEQDSGILSTISAGFFAALREIGRMLGEPHFSVDQFFSGKNHNIFITTAGESFFVMIVYRSRPQLDLVRVYSKSAIKDLQSLLSKVSTQLVSREAAGVLDTDFAAKLDRSLDELFDGSIGS